MSKELEISLKSPLARSDKFSYKKNSCIQNVLPFATVAVSSAVAPVGIVLATGDVSYLLLTALTTIGSIIFSAFQVEPKWAYNRVVKALQKKGIVLSPEDQKNLLSKYRSYTVFEFENSDENVSIEVQKTKKWERTTIIDITPKNEFNEAFYNALTLKNPKPIVDFDQALKVQLKNPTIAQLSIENKIAIINDSGLSYRMGMDDEGRMELKFTRSRKELFDDVKNDCLRDFRERLAVRVAEQST